MSRTRGHHTAHTNVASLDEHQSPDVDAQFYRVTEACRLGEAEFRAARCGLGLSDGELRRRPGKDAGEENQEPGDGWDGA